MLRRRLPLIALVIGASLAQPTAQAPRQSAPFDRSRQFVPAELLVGFRPAPTRDRRVYQLHGLEEREPLDPRGGRPALRRVDSR